MTALDRIMAILGMPEAEARAYCAEVRKAFRGRTPALETIAQELEKNPYNIGSPVELAAELACAVPTPQRPVRKKKRRAKGMRERVEAETPPSVRLAMAHDPREFVADLPKCPHGVLKTRKCALCDPEGFRDEYGEN